MRTASLGIALLVSYFPFLVLAALVLLGNSGSAKKTLKDPSRAPSSESPWKLVRGERHDAYLLFHCWDINGASIRERHAEA